MYRVDDELKVDFHHEAWIVPFAQKEMVYSFMKGIIPKYQIFIDNTLPHLLKKFQMLSLTFVQTILVKTKKCYFNPNLGIFLMSC